MAWSCARANRGRLVWGFNHPMRIRTIKPEFFTHEGLYEAEIETGLPIRVAFAGLWCVADREGRFKWEPRRIGVQVLPYDGVDFSRVLDALTTRGFVVMYRVNDACFGLIPSFQKHQVINNRESESVLPDPSSENVEFIEKYEENHASTTREGRVTHAGQGEGKGREGNKEGKGKEGRVDLGSSTNVAFEELKTRIGSWFKRRESTVWSPKEIKALKDVIALKTPPEDINALEARYLSGNPYLRRDIITLLNNWNTEIDRANQPTTQATSANANDPIARRNALLGDDVERQQAEAARISRARYLAEQERFERTGLTPFDEDLPSLPVEGHPVG
jgi:hypothetical protein